ncbi:hypothetical protein [Pseudoduganella sp. OTU4001]|uniref:hypothetical protein n=1 Tax=Pseudoduganella sp. OTU4001 TaxID=3043854 RepID=UPI00313F33F6
MTVKISTRGGALLSVHVPDAHGVLTNVLHGGLANGGIHLLPAPGRALHRLAWHAVPLVEDASVGVRLVSPGAPAVVAIYRLDDANALTLHCEVALQAPATLCLPICFNPGEHRLRVSGDGEHPRSVSELPATARYLAGEDGLRAVLLLADGLAGRQLELAGDLASLRASTSEIPGCLLLEPALAAPGGEVAFRFSAQA